MKIKILLYVYFVLNILFVIVLIKKSTGFYNSVKEEIVEKLPFSFRMATIAETEKRIMDNNIRSIKMRSSNRKETPTIRLTTMDTIIEIKKDAEYLSWSLDERSAMLFQTISVWQEHYLVVDDVRDLWQNALEEKDIHMQVAVMYRHRDFPDTQYSAGDSAFFHQATKIHEYRTGLFREVSLWGAYDITFNTIFSYAKKQFFIYGLLSLILLNSFLVTLYYIFKSHKIDLKTLAASNRVMWGVPIKPSYSYV